MKFNPTPLADAYRIELEPRCDDRGFFARQFCDEELKQIGFAETIVQINQSYNYETGTLRGLHFQLEPNAEVKIVQCVRGRIWDVIVDLRTPSPTFQRWFGIELNPASHQLLFVPKGFAHGYLTLEADSEVIYFVTARYSPKSERGLLWSDPTIGISWPAAPQSLSDKDAKNATLKELMMDGPLFPNPL